MSVFEDRVRGFSEVLREGSRLFRGEGELDKTARRLAEHLEAIGVPYALLGGYALIHHGVRRYTEDLDLIVSPDGLRRIHERLVGAGYRPLFEGSKNLRDAETGVRIELIKAGGYPGDGKPKPVAFPDPAAIPTDAGEHGIRFVDLPTLVELKLASGMTGGPARGKDISDVYELARLHGLDESFAARLNPYVRPRFEEILAALRLDQSRGGDQV